MDRCKKTISLEYQNKKYRNKNCWIYLAELNQKIKLCIINQNDHVKIYEKIHPNLQSVLQQIDNILEYLKIYFMFCILRKTLQTQITYYAIIKEIDVINRNIFYNDDRVKIAGLNSNGTIYHYLPVMFDDKIEWLRNYLKESVQITNINISCRRKISNKILETELILSGCAWLAKYLIGTEKLTKLKSSEDELNFIYPGDNPIRVKINISDDHLLDEIHIICQNDSRIILRYPDIINNQEIPDHYVLFNHMSKMQKTELGNKYCEVMKSIDLVCISN